MDLTTSEELLLRSIIQPFDEPHGRAKYVNVKSDCHPRLPVNSLVFPDSLLPVRVLFLVEPEKVNVVLILVGS